MKTHPLFIPAFIIFLLHQLLEKIYHIHISLADQYLDPLLCMPILLGIWQLEQYHLYRRHLNLFQIWSLTILLSILFEVGFPRFSSEFTADWRDVVLYFIGTTFFVTIKNYAPRRKKDRLLKEV
jgi:hypothetical protein